MVNLTLLYLFTGLQTIIYTTAQCKGLSDQTRSPTCFAWCAYRFAAQFWKGFRRFGDFENYVLQSYLLNSKKLGYFPKTHQFSSLTSVLFNPEPDVLTFLFGQIPLGIPSRSQKLSFSGPVSKANWQFVSLGPAKEKNSSKLGGTTWKLHPLQENLLFCDCFLLGLDLDMFF